MDEPSTTPRLHFSLLKILLVICVLVLGFYVAQRSGANPRQYQNDFNVYYFAAGELREGRTPYDNSLGEWTPYLYPPLLAELMLPLQFLPLPIAAYLWFLLSAAAVYATLRMSARLGFLDDSECGVPPSGGGFGIGRFRVKTGLQTMIPLITLIVLLRFIFDNFDYGQVNHIVAALCVAHLYFYQKDKKFASALLLVLAVSIKVTPLVFLIYHLARGRWKYVAACVALLLVVTAVSFAPFTSRAPAAFHTFVYRTIKNQQGFNFAVSGNQSLRGAIERLQGNDEARQPSNFITTIIGIALLALVSFAAFKATNDSAAAAPFFCCAVLLSPLSWKQHFVMLIFPVACLIGEALRPSKSQSQRWLRYTLWLVFALFNFTSPKLIGITAAEWCDAHSLVFLGALMLFVATNTRALVPRRQL